MYNPHKQLVMAVVGRAIGDYRKALANLEKNSNYEAALKIKNEIDQFFKSEWFEFLCEIYDVRKTLKRENIINDN